MYRTIVIPLDASDVAEAVLAHVRQLVAPQYAELILVHSVEPQEYAFLSGVEQPELYARLLNSIEQQTSTYLTNVREQLQSAGYAVTIHIAKGDAAQFIVDVAVQEQADLIAMTTHGRTGFARWALGSVADRVIRTAHQPVYLVRSNVPPSPNASLQQILVPLDGSRLAETVLDQAASLARERGANVILMRVLKPLTDAEQELLAAAELAGDDSRMDTGVVAKTIAVTRVEQAQAYLHGAEERLQRAGIATEVHLFTGTPAKAICETAQAKAVDLIMMSTHGYGGYTRWVYGSVANTVLHDAPCPVLLNRAFPKGATLFENPT